MESKFRFKKSQILRMDERSHGNISNNNMTDEKAIAFLRPNHNRIKLFSKYPENWVELISESTLVDYKVLKAAEAISEAKNDSKEDKPSITSYLEEDLLKTKMTVLRKQFPEVHSPFGMTKVEFVQEILEHLNK